MQRLIFPLSIPLLPWIIFGAIVAYIVAPSSDYYQEIAGRFRCRILGEFIASVMWPAILISCFRDWRTT